MAEETKDKRLALHASRFKEAEGVRRIWDIVPEHGTPFEALLKSDYWAHVAKMLRPFDRIEVRAEDGSYFAELIVRDAGRMYAKVEALRKVDLGAVTAEAGDAEYEVQWGGPYHKHRVLRTKDKTVMKSGFDTKDAAQSWMINHARVLAA